MVVDATAISVAVITAAGVVVTADFGFRGLRQKADLSYAELLDRKQREYVETLEKMQETMKGEIQELKEQVERVTQSCAECTRARNEDQNRIVGLLMQVNELRMGKR